MRRKKLSDFDSAPGGRGCVIVERLALSPIRVPVGICSDEKKFLSELKEQ